MHGSVPLISDCATFFHTLPMGLYFDGFYLGSYASMSMTDHAQCDDHQHGTLHIIAGTNTWCSLASGFAEHETFVHLACGQILSNKATQPPPSRHEH
jgi:hypothetical protein